MPHEPYRGVWIVAEQSGGKLERVSLEILGKARELAEQLKVPCSAVVLGENVKPLARELIAHGADTVYVAEHRELKHYRNLPYRRVVCDLVREHKPEILILGATTVGRELAPSIAARLESGITTDATELVVGPYYDKITKQEYQEIFQPIRPSFEESVLATIVGPRNMPQMASVRPGVFPLKQPDPKRKGEVIAVKPTFHEEDLVVVVEKVEKVEKTLDLTSAKSIASLGMGVHQDPERGKKLCAELAALLPGGMVGSSRAAVEAGYMPRQNQVGQTGQTVRPELYIASGISGQIQHIFGMKHSKVIIAVNTDEKAPITSAADYCLVGDLFAVLPALIAELKARK